MPMQLTLFTTKKARNSRDKIIMSDSEAEDLYLPPLKKKKRFLSPKKDDEMSLITKGYVPSNTRKQTDWAVRVFSEWRRQRNESDKSSQCPADLFEVPDCEQLNYWLPPKLETAKVNRILLKRFKTYLVVSKE